MSESFQNQLLVNVGSVLAADGTILLLAARRFARLRTNDWMPRVVDDALGGLADNGSLGRALGLLAAAGVGMIALGIGRSRPLT